MPISRYFIQALLGVAMAAGTASAQVIWSVSEAGGGEIDGNGRYVAPQTAGVYHVVARSAVDASQMGSATVGVSTPPPPVGGGSYAVTSAACAAEPLRQTGTTYYVCDCGAGADSRCAAGNGSASDSNSPAQARSPATPWRSYAKAMAQFHLLAAGDTIAFCRGGAFAQNAESYWTNTACRATNTCDVRDYDPPWDTDHTAALPLITSSGYARLFGLWNRGSPQQPQQGYRLLNLRLRGAPGATLWGVGIGSATTDSTLCNLIIDGPRIGVQDDGHGNTSQRTTVKGSKIVNTSSMGVLMGGNGNVIADNYFDQNGSEPTFDHSIYLSVAGTATGEVVSGNEIHHSVMSGGLCRGNVIVAHGQHQGLLIENNFIDSAGIAGGGCWGIGLTPGGYSAAEYFRNAVVRRNRIYGVGSAGIAADMCTNCLIENNLVVVDGTGSGGVYAINAPSRVYTAHGSDQSASITIRNNTVYFTTGATAGGTGIVGINDGSGHVVSNNSISWYGKGPHTCLSLQASYAAVTNNACYGYAGNGGSIGYSSPGAVTVTAAPRFLDTSQDSILEDNFVPAQTSPLVDAADPGHAASQDITGATRQGPPDIGAYER